MNIENLISPELIVTGMPSGTKAEALKALTQLLSQAGLVSNDALVLDKVREREDLGHTGLGHGVAVPHARCEGADGLSLAIGICPEGLDFDSGDGEPVSILVLIVANQRQMGAHVVAVAQISRILHKVEVRKRVLKASTREEVAEILIDAARNLAQQRRRAG